MQTFGILGFTFGLIAFAMVNKLTKDVKDVKHLQRQMEDIKQRLPPAQSF